MDNDIAKLYDQWRDTVTAEERSILDLNQFILLEAMGDTQSAKVALVYTLLYRDRTTTKFALEARERTK